MLEDAYRSAIVAFNTRDLDRWLGMMDRDVEIESRFSRMHEQFRGQAEMKLWWDDLEGSETLALVHLHGRGRGSAAPRCASPRHTA